MAGGGDAAAAGRAPDSAVDEERRKRLRQVGVCALLGCSAVYLQLQHDLFGPAASYLNNNRPKHGHAVNRLSLHMVLSGRCSGDKCTGVGLVTSCDLPASELTCMGTVFVR